MQDPKSVETLIMVFGPAFLIMVGLIGWFGNRMMSRIESKLETVVTNDQCEKTRGSCEKIRESCKLVLEAKRTLEKRDIDELNDRVKDLIEAFDDLVSCISKFTKGECP